MDQNTRLRTKIGDNEFEAEGPPDLVEGQFAAWKALVELALSARKPDGSDANFDPDNPNDKRSPRNGPLSREELDQVFLSDDKRNLVTLRVLPRGDDRHAKGISLVLYGFSALRGEEEVPVTRLKASLESSGSVPDRIDRAAAPLLESQSVVKSGAGKGGRYRLTNRGKNEAEQAVRGLVSQLM